MNCQYKLNPLLFRRASWWMTDEETQS